MRAWCLQEIVMAKEASIYLGMFPWTGERVWRHSGRVTDSGLVDPADPCHSGPTMIPDYTKRLSDLLIRVIIHLLKHHSLDILSFATVRLIPKKFIHDVFFLPKWGPDWRETSLTEGAHFAFTTFSWPRILLGDLWLTFLAYGSRLLLHASPKQSKPPAQGSRRNWQTLGISCKWIPRNWRPRQFRKSRLLHPRGVPSPFAFSLQHQQRTWSPRW